ncbi:MAG: LPS export ABC transporter permease LptG [gamma proteobacterium symbiont of Bathyaustriella thionipta]|nr:LPS export ABC transporter permease LptG [gamma proteobacterium symbiont of Bathyaustriella thionipta]MCU7950550.1 LPS export ABC transporter permease LptG [gamma proteobacterium symbiont of Bathyaustriella thionipta]MCU7953025.1 LPS export ABC transporter permease LptG [gamma proteobacterium symbiont of Bathyaustriella thionipta]MCU7957058.1 LPS export ABC transporter permease LptG [gamma proteobacterium symbiont of Bathyaustriella thionipta]
MNILDRYIIKAVIYSTLLFLLIILSLYGFITLADNFKYIGKGTFEMNDAFYYTLFTLPRRMYQLFPFSVLLGAMMGLGALNSKNELIAIRAAGVSIIKIIFSVMKAAFILAVFMFLVGEFILPITEKIAENHWSTKVHGTTHTVSADAIWVRDKNTFTKIHAITSDKTLGNVSIFSFSDDKSLKVSTQAASAYYDGNDWILNDIQQTFISEDKVVVNKIDKARWPTLLDLELVDVIISKLEYLSASGLYRYSTYLDVNNLDSTQYWLAFWDKMVQPFSIAAMLLLSVPFVFSSTRTSNAGSRLMIGVIIGVIFTIANKITAQFGLVYDLSPFFSASFVTISIVIIASLLIRRMT